jgi:hypothetical protein
MRGLTVIGGLIAVTQAGPIARASWEAQSARPVALALNTDRKVDQRSVDRALASLTRAVSIDPSAPTLLDRSELLAAAALSRSLDLKADKRTEWERMSRADLVSGLAAAPAHGIDWLRLAVVQFALEGASPTVVSLVLTSIQMAPRAPQAFQPRLRLILQCWALFTDAQKEALRAHAVMMWRQSKGDRRLFAYVSYSEADYLILVWLLRDEPGAVKEFTDLVQRVSKE